jgi:hypothetical protein
MPIQKTTVPVFKMYEVPQCPYCKTPFFLHHGQGESYETWRQRCACEPVGKEPYSRVYIPQDGRWWMEDYFHGENIGKPIVTRCVLCSQPMTEGEEAYLGCMGKYSYCGYAHVLCYEQMLEGIAKARRDAEMAEKGWSIAFWFSIANKLKPAPNTGHYDGEVRLVPEELPPFPEGSVVYERYRRPFAMSYVDIPVLRDAETWWREATANDRVTYELHWYEPGKKREQATRSWRGKGFGAVESEARMAEWDAERNMDM